MAELLPQRDDLELVFPLIGNLADAVEGLCRAEHGCHGGGGCARGSGPVAGRREGEGRARESDGCFLRYVVLDQETVLGHRPGDLGDLVLEPFKGVWGLLAHTVNWKGGGHTEVLDGPEKTDVLCHGLLRFDLCGQLPQMSYDGRDTGATADQQYSLE